MTPRPTATPVAVIKRGGTLKYSPSDDLGVFDPMFSGGLGDIFHGTLIYETLFAYDNTGLPNLR